MTDNTWNTAADAQTRTAILRNRLDEARQTAPVGSCWRHKHGGLYMVHAHSIDSDTGEARVKYHRIGGPDFDFAAEHGINFSRPISEWTVDRFTFID